jgi:DNA-binding MurR/RpiR family transcriptional regulator
MGKRYYPGSFQTELVCTARIFTLSPHFTKADQALADLTVSHPQSVLKMSSREFGKHCGVSEASVIRFVQKLGYEGLTEYREALQQELLTSQTTASPGLVAKNTPAEILANVVTVCSQALQSLKAVLDVNELDRAARLMEKAEIIHFFAAGGSTRVAQHAVFKLMRMGYLSISHEEPFAQMAQASLVGPHSVAFGISFTGATKGICEVLAVARESGAPTICLTNFAGTQITECAEIRLITGSPGGVLAANSAQARVAQFAVLDSLFALMRLRNEDHREPVGF